MKDYIKQGARNHIHNLDGFDSMHLTTLDEGYALVHARTGTGFANTRNFIHGGVLMALCDMTVSAAVYSYGKRNVTLQCNFNFIRGVDVDDGSLMACEAHVVHNGKKTVVAEVTVKDAQERLCVKATFTQFVVQLMDENDEIPMTPTQKAMQ